MKWQVTYPLITMDGSKTFETEKEAQEFAKKIRDALEVSPYATPYAWRMVRISEVKE